MSATTISCSTVLASHEPTPGTVSPCFRADTVLELFEVVQSQPVTFPPDVPASDALKDLLLHMLTKVGYLSVCMCVHCMLPRMR